MTDIVKYMLILMAYMYIADTAIIVGHCDYNLLFNMKFQYILYFVENGFKKECYFR